MMMSTLSERTMSNVRRVFGFQNLFDAKAVQDRPKNGQHVAIVNIISTFTRLIDGHNALPLLLRRPCGAIPWVRERFSGTGLPK